MKTTATVPPLPSLLQRNKERTSSMQNQAAAARNDDEGSFAAALRKLAQQAIVPVGRRPAVRDERQQTPPSSFKPGSSNMETTKSPPRTNGNGRQSHSPFYSRNNMRPSSIASSSIASILPSNGAFEKEKSEIHSKGPYGVSSTPDDHHSRRMSRPIFSGVIPHHETTESIYRQSRDEGTLHLGEKRPIRDAPDPVSRAHNVTGMTNGPSNGQLNILGIKDRGSNIGLVHPQPVRKLPDDEALKSGIMNSIRSHPMESHGSLFRPPSPAENLSRYQLVHGLHQHNSQGACPVHGHESGHHHGSPRDHAGRPGRLPFDGMPPRSGPISEYRGIHPHHQRMRDELYSINRIPFERRDGLPSHVLEEDLRRRGYDWPWTMQHPLYESEQYRRHMVNGYRGSEHAYKEVIHGPHYMSPHLYYPPEYPPMDPYAHPSMPPSDVFPNRYSSAQLSPRLYDYYRRDRPLSERATDRSESRRQDSVNLKLGQSESDRRSTEHSIADGRSMDERNSRRSEISDYFSFSKERVAHISSKDDRKERNSLENIIEAIGKKASAESDEPRRKMRIMENLKLVAKPYDERDSTLDNVVIKKEPEASVQSYYQVESPQRNERTLSDNSDEISRELAPETMEKKSNFMASIGLISHGKRRVLEEDYERKRWERKVAKMRAKPRKRRKREHTEDSDGRPCSELDFYNGPMTRHKQQLLQEQEMILEQVQKNHLERSGSKETSSGAKAYSYSSSPTNSSVASNTPNSLNESMFQTAPLERNTENETSNSFASKSQGFKPYKERQHRKEPSNVTNGYQKCDTMFSKESQTLDGFVFGLPQVDASYAKSHWPGVDGVARLFADYENGSRQQHWPGSSSTCSKAAR